MKKALRNKYLIVFIIVSVLTTCSFVYFKKIQPVEPDIVFNEPTPENNTDELNINNNSADTNSNSNINSAGEPKKEEGPIDSALIKMSFLVQAPGSNWDALHEDACEEASLIMVYHYYNKTKVDSDLQGENEIQKLIECETRNGYGLSITLNELNRIAKDYYQMNTGRIIEAKKDVIIAELNKGKPIIAPAAGKLLANPNFRNGGPNYHMLVVKGYDKNGFITNDPGTRKGEGFRYAYQNLLEAIHDWSPDNIVNGAKNALVFD